MTYSYDPDRAITAKPDFYGKPTGGYNNPAPGKAQAKVEYQCRLVFDTYTGKKYRSLREASIATKIKYTRIFSECNNIIVSEKRFEYIGEALEEVKDAPKRGYRPTTGRVVIANGVRYPSIQMACNANGINNRTGYRRIKEGKWRLV